MGVAREEQRVSKPEIDHDLAGRFVAYVMEYETKGQSDLARQVGVDRGVIRRLIGGFPGTRSGTLRRVEDALGLPEYAINYVREHDLEELRSAGLAERPMRWLTKQLEEGRIGQARNHRAV